MTENAIDMKSAYELAMERLNKSAPTIKLTAAQKQELADLEARYKAKVAEREIGLQEKVNQFQAAGEFDQASQLEQQLLEERKALAAELEAKKDKVRQGGQKR